MTDDTEIDVSGAELEIDGELHYVESGTLTIQRDGIWDPNGELVKVTTRQITIGVDLYEPETSDD